MAGACCHSRKDYRGESGPDEQGFLAFGGFWLFLSHCQFSHLKQDSSLQTVKARRGSSRGQRMVPPAIPTWPLSNTRYFLQAQAQTLPTGLYTFLTLTLKWLCSQMSCSNLYASGCKRKVHGSHTWGYFISSCKLMSENLTCRIYYLREQMPCPQSYFRVLAHVPLKELFVDPVIEGRAGG